MREFLVKLLLSEAAQCGNRHEDPFKKISDRQEIGHKRGKRRLLIMYTVKGAERSFSMQEL